MQKSGGTKRPLPKSDLEGIHHVHIVIADALCWPDERLFGFLSDDNGELSAQETRTALFACQAMGHTYFCGCDNPGPDGRCAGHEK